MLPGRVERLSARRVPQIGWNSVEAATDPLLAASGLTIGYYANSYCVRPRHAADVSAWSVHEDDRFPAVMRRGRAVGVQFHPEKSSRAGLAFVRACIEETRT
ncbi:MAG: hypothetical protein HY275_07350 [Gemmatimonadetes bacterium]|nr:hypothetical protein [Gemmatimonadota bacterium]